MVKYEVLGFKSENEYISHFLGKLLPTNRTYDFFVDWEKVREHVKKYVKEISLLNSLAKVSSAERKALLKDIFIKYPETIPVIPLIIAVREKEITIVEIGEEILHRTFNFTRRRLTEKDAEILVNFCDKTGILQLFSEINDLYAYLLGVEVGLDTNARKNRSGKMFQKIVGIMLKKKLSKLNVIIKEENIPLRIGRGKKADFVVYYRGSPKVIVECSFYHTSGSKPIETANSYINLQQELRKRNLTLIWITDGPAWKDMKKQITRAIRKLDFPLNYTIANEKIKDIINYIISSKNSRQTTLL